MNQVIQEIIDRRSCRSFEPRQLENEALQQILTAGTYAASGKGLQSAIIVVLQDPEQIRALEEMNAAILDRPGTHTFYGAPTVLVVLARADRSTAVCDGSLVIGNLMLAASSLGIGSCWIHRAKEEFESAAGKALLRSWGVEGDYIGVGHCILGYPAGPLKEAAPRKDNFIIYPKAL